MAEKKYVKMYCQKSKCYGLVTIEVDNGVSKICNFYEIDDDTAKNINNVDDSSLPQVSGYLKPCFKDGTRNPLSCDMKRQCSVKKGELWYQCIYCKDLEICNSISNSASYNIYFIMDESGSMSYSDRKEGSNAVRKLIQSLVGNGNTYSFVAFGSYAGYVFKNETNIDKISSALKLYENDNTGYGGSTAADLAFETIKNDVFEAKKPIRIILVTDGYFDSLDRTIEVRNSILKCRNDIEILAIGVTGADNYSLGEIGTVPEFSKVIGDAKNLTHTFEDIANLLKNKGNNF
ncbi:MAG: VWA domain-containing protein [Clostridia bacterium]|nr:VWA domain-containing protein [Clostridia bacterium]